MTAPMRSPSPPSADPAGLSVFRRERRMKRLAAGFFALLLLFVEEFGR